jgi:DNA/RNA-binding protein KIN17
MKIFSEHAHGMLDNLSREFEKAYLDTLRQRHGTKRVNANNIYQEVIRDRHHIHMNATKWVTLTDFCQYLGRTGKCVVDETERGWYVQYIERDATILAREEALQRRLEAEKAAEVTESQRMEAQRVEAAKALDRAGGGSSEATTLERKDEAKIAVTLASAATKKGKASATKQKSIWNDGDEDDEDDVEIGDEHANKVDKPLLKSSGKETIAGKKHLSTSRTDQERKSVTKTVHDRNELTANSSRKRTKHEQVDQAAWKENWLHRGILVRIITKQLAQGKYYKRKAKINQVLDGSFTAEVEVLASTDDDGGDILRLDQDDLETVVPKETGARVLIVNGPGHGQRAKVVRLDKKQYLATLALDENGVTMEHVDFEHFSMIAE